MARPVLRNALKQRKIDRIIAVFRRNEIFCNYLELHFFTFNVIPALSAQDHHVILSRSQRGNGFLIVYDNILTIVIFPYGHCGSVVALHSVLRIVENNRSASVDIRILLRHVVVRLRSVLLTVLRFLVDAEPVVVLRIGVVISNGNRISLVEKHLIQRNLLCKVRLKGCKKNLASIRLLGINFYVLRNTLLVRVIQRLRQIHVEAVEQRSILYRALYGVLKCLFSIRRADRLLRAVINCVDQRCSLGERSAEPAARGLRLALRIEERVFLRRRRRRDRTESECGIKVDHKVVLRSDRRKAGKRRYDHCQDDQ